MQIIGFKKFRERLGEIPDEVKKGKGFKVFKNNEHVFDVVPVDTKFIDGDDGFRSGLMSAEEKKNFLEGLEKLKFSGGDPNLSEKIDDIAWGDDT